MTEFMRFSIDRFADVVVVDDVVHLLAASIDDPVVSIERQLIAEHLPNARTWRIALRITLERAQLWTIALSAMESVGDSRNSYDALPVQHTLPA